MIGKRVDAPAPVATNEDVFVFPLSLAQRRLWLVDRLDPGRSAYNLHQSFRLEGRLDLAALGCALIDLVARHETLRTTFDELDGEPVQLVAPSGTAPLPVVDLSALSRRRRAGLAERLASEQADRPFDLTCVPLLRVMVLRLAAAEHAVLCTLHHIVSDAASLAILLRDVAALYNARRTGWPADLPELLVQYADYSEWQRRRLDDTELAGQEEYWRGALAGELPSLDLPQDRRRPLRPSFRGATSATVVDAAATDRLRALARDEQVTPFTVLLAVFEVLLSRAGGRRRFLVGTPASGRDRVEVEELIGFFVDTLPVPADLTGDPSLRELLGRVQRTVLEGRAHAGLPFDQMVERLGLRRPPGVAPLLQVLFTVDEVASAPAAAVPRLDGLRLEPLDWRRRTAKVDLTGRVAVGDELSLELEYSTDLFDAATVEHLLQQYRHLLEVLPLHPDLPLSHLDGAGERERALLGAWSGEERPYPRQAGLAELFARQVARAWDAPALEWGEERLSYRELDRWAGAVAGGLRQAGVGPGVAVGVLARRSPELVAGWLGALQAGGFYVPLDPDFPPERLRFTVADAGAAVVLVAEGLDDRLPPGGERRLPLRAPGVTHDVGPEGGVKGGPPAASASGSGVDGGSPAYVVYTSGSTGRPKGVLVPQRAVARLVVGTDYVELGPGVRVAQGSTPTFDAATFEVWGALLHGGCLVGVPQEVLLSPPALAGFLRRRRLDVLFLTTALFHQVAREVPNAFAALDVLVVGGETIDPGRVREVLTAGAPRRLVNGYGPTENTTFSTWHEVRSVAVGAVTVPIGRAVANSRAYVVDQRLRPVAMETVGELVVGGDGVAVGYLACPRQTAERFVPDPLGERPGARLYRTGDLARWRTGGWIEFLGRRDHQVKLRGYRIELGEVEAALRSHPAVEEAVVLVRGGGEAGGDDGGGAPRRLVAYVAVPGVATAESLRAHVAQRLPVYMVPTGWVMLDVLPLSATGKLDRRSLAALPVPAAVDGGGRPPEGPVETHLAALFAELLGTDSVGRDDDFFALGGHSLLATQLISRLRAELAVELPLVELFDRRTVAALAGWIETARRGTAEPILRRRRDRPLPLSFAQQRLWLIDRLAPGSPAYNVPAALELAGPLSVAALQAALARVVRRHEALRTTFELLEGEPVQHIHPFRYRPLPLVDLAALGTAALPQTRRLAAAEAARRFDLERGPLLRSTLVRLEPHHHVLLLTQHHVVSDGWSLARLVDEVATVYQAHCEGRPARLPALPVQYADYAAWQRERLQGEELERRLEYWRRHLAGVSADLPLPFDRPRPTVRTARGGSTSVRIPAAAASGLRRLAAAAGATDFMALLAVFQLLLGRCCGCTRLAVGTPVAGRDRLELEPLIGFFVNTLVLDAAIDPDASFPQWLRVVRTRVTAAFTHQDLPFERLVEELAPQRDLRRPPLVQVVFALQNAPQAAPRLAGVEVRELDAGSRPTARFDLALSLIREGDTWSGRFGYSTDLFDATTVRRLGGHYVRLLSSLVEAPWSAVGSASWLSAAERQQVVVEWSGAGVSGSVASTVAGRFVAAASARPEAVAVVWGTEHLSYGELERRSRCLATRLRRLGVVRESRVGLLLERSARAVVGVLGVWRSGGAYVPLDPRAPAERTAWLLADAGAGTVVAADEEVPCARVQRVAVEVAHGSPASPAEAAAWAPEPEDLAYVLYTSGSTGAPKGALIRHRSPAHVLDALVGAVLEGEAGPGLRAGWNAPLSFDASVKQLLHLALGNRLDVVPEALRRDGEAMVEWMVARGVEVVETTPSQLGLWLAAALAERRGGPRRVLVGGEALEEGLWRRLAGGARRYFNSYGPTEATINTTTCRVAGERPSLGRPLAGVRAWVVDAALRPVPVGVAGELAIGGPGLARGYLGRPALTSERFVPHPFGAVGERLYRSGDRVRWRPDGRLEYLGRLDAQIKLRGHRIEPGEVEAALLAHPAVTAAAVVLRELPAGDPGLVAYVCAPGAEEGALRDHLRRRLPHYMLPARIVPLDALPLNRHGKIDRQRLPEPPASGGGSRAAGAARSREELLLVQLWEDLLSVEGIGVEDDFFALGGHSLLAVRLVAAVERRFGRKLPLAALFEAPTIERLAARLASAPGATAAGSELLVPVQPRGDRPPLHWVHPSGGGVLCYASLARRLGGEQPFYAFQAAGYEGGEPLTSVGAMARRYLDELRAQQSRGPYRLGGWSMGGLVAQHMAVLLRDAGETVAWLALLDTHVHSGRRYRPSEKVLRRSFALELGIQPHELPAGSACLAPGELLERCGHHGLLPPDLDERRLEHLFGIFAANARASAAHRPHRYEGEIHLYRAEQPLRPPTDPTLGWGRYAPRLRIEPVPGDHYSLLGEPLVAELARRLHHSLEGIPSA